ncbi:MAG: DEAD/DEAH box helicase [Candidatus Omnitrophica bacterium]|nr:DEAD/DEAH box helicase [Candidatus Omnitrophota bacterium]
MNNPIILDTFQAQAIEHAKNGNSVIVSAPTGAGKTLIAEHIIDICLSRNKGVVYTAPIKALSNQKFRDFSRKYPEKTGILTGDVNINRQAPILIMTTEIFRNALLVTPEDFQNRDWVIFDEIHFIDDLDRGTVWEESIILLPKHMRMLGLSATIANHQEFLKWLKEVHSNPIETVVENLRPVPLHFFFQCNDQIFQSFDNLKQSKSLIPYPFNLPYRDNQNKSHSNKQHIREYPPQIINSKPNRMESLLGYLSENQSYPCLYFAFSRRRCEDLAQDVSYFDFLNQQEKEKVQKLFNDLTEKLEIPASAHINFLYSLIKHGIAYHHAGLIPPLKEIVEQLFSSGLIKLIFTTETFALGINMPARTVVFDSLSKFYGRSHHYLRTRDFYQMAGRAGRRGIDKEGFVFSKVSPSSIDIESLNRIIYGQYEPVRSQFNSCYATILNLYKIMGEKIYDIYPRSLHFVQAKALEKKEVLGLLKRKISLLKNMGYISENETPQKADIAAKVYSFELAIGELSQQGYLENISEEDLFVIITALVYEPRKGEQRPQINKSSKILKKDMRKLMRLIHREERRHRIYPFSKKFYFNLSPACRQWFRGVNFSALGKFFDCDEGEIVRYFRMSIQVLREISSSTELSPSLRAKVKNCIKKVNRDIIDARKQLQQNF